MQLLDQEEFKEYFKGYYHDEHFADEQNKEKLKIEGQTLRQGGQTTMGGVRKESSDVDSQTSSS